MNKLYEPFDTSIKSKLDKLINDLELIDEIIKTKHLENNQVYLDFKDKLNKISIN